MSFTLTPPLLVKNNIAFAILQPNEEDDPELLVIEMAGWSPLQLLIHWRREIEMLLDGGRTKCCIVSGLALVDDVTIPSEWWTMYLVGEQARLQYQVLRVSTSREWIDPSNWWQNIAPYNPVSVAGAPVSEWNVSLQNLADWRVQCDMLITSIEALKK